MEKRLERDESNKVIAGVASGLAEYLEMDISLVRVIFILLAIFGSAGIWIYLILWIVVPARRFAGFDAYDPGYKADVPPAAYPPVSDPHSLRPVKHDDRASIIVGLILLIAGMYFLLDQFNLIPYWFSVAKLWPVIFIIIGLVILFRSANREPLPGSYKSTGGDEKKTTENVNDVHVDKTGEQPLNE